MDFKGFHKENSGLLDENSNYFNAVLINYLIGNTVAIN